MVKFRVEYFDEVKNEIGVINLDAEDSNELKTLWNQKYKKKGKLIGVCDLKVYEEMSKKYGNLMKPINYNKETIYLLKNEKEEWWILPYEDQEVINANITLGIDITSYKGEVDKSIFKGYKTYEDAFKAYGYEKLHDEVDWEWIFNYKA